MNILSRIPSPLSVDGAYLWFQVLSLLFLAATILTGAGTIITGFIANRRTATALAVQQERAAKAEAALKVLEGERQPRHLSAEQSAKLVNSLRESARQAAKTYSWDAPIDVQILYSADADDASPFATEIKQALTSAGVTITFFNPTRTEAIFQFGNDALYGVTVVDSAYDMDTPAANLLTTALETAGIHVKRTKEPIAQGAKWPPLDRKHPSVRILVGARPNPRIIDNPNIAPP
jgi:hypothetical protein